jgi:hypothetical protein
MDAKAAVAAVLGAVNDHTYAHPYGDGLLIDLSLTYGDGDAVRILVEPMGTGIRASDRATAASLLAMAGVDITSGRAAEAFAEAIRGAHLNGVGAHAGEIATFGSQEDLGSMILNVAQASLRVDQLRWLAHQQPAVTFAEQVTSRVESWAGRQRQIERDPVIRLSSGRSRRVTVAVSGGGRTAYIQAVSARDRDRSTEHCYYLFGNANRIPKEQKIAALAGSHDSWPEANVAELTTVGVVQFFDELTGLERQLDAVVPASQSALQS